jgi:hypothetical protein
LRAGVSGAEELVNVFNVDRVVGDASSLVLLDASPELVVTAAVGFPPSPAKMKDPTPFRLLDDVVVPS